MSNDDDVTAVLNNPRRLTDQETASLSEVRDAAIALGKRIVDLTPSCDEQQQAIQRVREAVCWAEDALRRGKRRN